LIGEASAEFQPVRWRFAGKILGHHLEADRSFFAADSASKQRGKRVPAKRPPTLRSWGQINPFQKI
jgi:hypothetical protein